MKLDYIKTIISTSDLLKVNKLLHTGWTLLSMRSGNNSETQFTLGTINVVKQVGQ